MDGEKKECEVSNGDVAGRRRLETGRQSLTGTQQGGNA